ncbi:MAG: hypothetical protein H7338_11120 [Candidatus Sericytochromatia bacterium]|nr:hypothetical protein [Candidatus Sericytochromatia bacterium]
MLRRLRDALRAARQGDLTIRLTMQAPNETGDGLEAEVAMAFNALVG